MARPRGSDEVLQERLELKLKAISPERTTNQRGLAQILGMSQNGLRDIHIKIDPEFPIESAGAEGKSYVFNVAKALAHMIRRCKERIAKAESDNAWLEDIQGLELPQRTTQMPIGDLSKQVDLTIKIVDRREKQGGYVSSAVVTDMFAGYNSAAIQGVLGVKVQIDPTGSLPPEISAMIDERLRIVAVAMSKKCESYIKEYHARTVESGNRGDSAATRI